MNQSSIGATCPFCKEGKLEFMKGREPWTNDHLMCDRCNSTYCIEDSE